MRWRSTRIARCSRQDRAAPSICSSCGRGADGQLSSDEPRTAQVDQQTIGSVAFSPDGHWLAAGGEGGLTLWKLDSRGRAHAVPLDGSRQRKINAVAFAQGSPAPRRHDDDGSARLGPRASTTRRAARRARGQGARRCSRRQPLGDRRPRIRLARFAGRGGRATGPGPSSARSIAEELLAAGDAHGQVVLWDVARGRMIGQPLRARPVGSTPRFRA